MAVRAVAAVALALAVALGPRVVAAAAPVRASIEVDATAAGDDAEALARAVADEGNVVLRDADVLPSRGSDDGTIHVVVAPLGAAGGFRFEAWAEHGAKELEGTRVAADCPRCSDRDLAQAVAKEITALVDPLREATEAATPSEPEPQPDLDPDPDPDPDPAPVDRGRVKIGGLGIGGIVLMAVGVGSIGGGAALLARGRDVAPEAGDPSRLVGRDYRPGGGALMAVGVAAAITGAVMLFVAVKRGKEARAGKTAFAPAVGGFKVAF